jgi:hypothetical protein
MAYIPKAGSLTLFRNDRKEKDSHPDYKGDGMDLEGNLVWVSAWVKEGAKGQFFSISMQKKEQAASAPAPIQRTAPRPAQPAQRPSPDFADLDSDLPF